MRFIRNIQTGVASVLLFVALCFAFQSTLRSFEEAAVANGGTSLPPHSIDGNLHIHGSVAELAHSHQGGVSDHVHVPHKHHADDVDCPLDHAPFKSLSVATGILPNSPAICAMISPRAMTHNRACEQRCSSASLDAPRRPPRHFA